MTLCQRLLLQVVSIDTKFLAMRTCSSALILVSVLGAYQKFCMAGQREACNGR